MANRSFFDSFIPPKYDFYGMLKEQAEITALGTDTLYIWLKSPSAANYEKFMRLVYDADLVRMRLEEQLIEAFSTPFDRQDIYTFSVRMDRIIELGKSTLLAMQDYEVQPDSATQEMAQQLSGAMQELAKATALLANDPKKAEASVDNMRQAYTTIETRYREAMAVLFKSAQPMEALKMREVYGGLKEAAGYLDLVVDVFHRIIVRIV